MPQLRTLRPLLRTIDARTTPLPPKRADTIYTTPEFRAWRAEVIRRAGRRCEAVDEHGLRCTRAWPADVLFADHIHELKDGGSPFDLRNGQALCKWHHERKTAQARAARR